MSSIFFKNYRGETSVTKMIIEFFESELAKESREGCFALPFFYAVTTDCLSHATVTYYCTSSKKNMNIPLLVESDLPDDCPPEEAFLLRGESLIGRLKVEFKDLIIFLHIHGHRCQRLDLSLHALLVGPVFIQGDQLVDVQVLEPVDFPVESCDLLGVVPYRSCFPVAGEHVV